MDLTLTKNYLSIHKKSYNKIQQSKNTLLTLQKRKTNKEIGGGSYIAKNDLFQFSSVVYSWVIIL